MDNWRYRHQTGDPGAPRFCQISGDPNDAVQPISQSVRDRALNRVESGPTDVDSADFLEGIGRIRVDSSDAAQRLGATVALRTLFGERFVEQYVSGRMLSAGCRGFAIPRALLAAGSGALLRDRLTAVGARWDGPLGGAVGWATLRRLMD